MSSFATMPEFWANELLMQLYEKSTMLNLVHTDYSALIAEKGEKVHVQRPQKCSVIPVDTNNFVSADINVDNVDVLLDKWIQTTPLKITDRVLSLSQVDLVSMCIEPMAQSLVKYIEQDLIAVADTFTNKPSVGLPSTIADFANFKKAFDVALCPDGSRNMVLSPDAEVKYQSLYGVYNTAGQAGVETQVTGQLGVKHGMNFYGSTLVNPLDAGFGFHKNAVCLVSRAPQTVPFAPIGQQAVISFRGVGLRVMFIYDGKARSSFVSADILFGTAKLDDRLGFKITLA